MKVLKLKIYQPHAHYRVPFTFIRRHTYPIPPYSTVVGLLCNILSIRGHEAEDFNRIKNELHLAVYGRYKSIVREYIWLRNLCKKYHIKRFTTAGNRFKDQVPEHPGGQMPTKIDVLEEVNLLIYIYHHDFSFLEKLAGKLLSPEDRIYPIHLGRAEDWIVFDGGPNESIKIIDVHEGKSGFLGKLELFTWIPRPSNGVKSTYYEPEFYPENYGEFYTKIRGSSHLVTSLYRLSNGVRVFSYVPVKLFEGGSFPLFFGRPFKFLVDEDIPLFFVKMCYPESQ